MVVEVSQRIEVSCEKVGVAMMMGEAGRAGRYYSASIDALHTAIL